MLDSLVAVVFCLSQKMTDVLGSVYVNALIASHKAINEAANGILSAVLGRVGGDGVSIGGWGKRKKENGTPQHKVKKPICH